MAPSSADLQPHRVIGRYALYDALAAGGMATVHLGRLIGPVGFSRTVAIKRLHEQFATDPEFVSGFLDEARLAARIQHPNVVPTLDVVATEGQLFLVMEYVKGESVSRLLKVSMAQERPISPRIAVSVVIGALHGLHAAHEAKSERGEPLHIVHRDVSPQNILVGIDGVPRVLDFGVAKAVGRLQSTRSGQIKGKVAYMSPEQIQSEAVDRRTDVFAAAVVLWELLTGRRLFGGETEAAALTKILFGDIEPPSTYASDLPKGLDEIVLRGLERDPAKRWQTARDMALALEECVPPTTATQIGAWVEGLAHESLVERAGRVAEIESVTTLPDAQRSDVLSEIRRGDGSPSGRSLPTGPAPDSPTISQQSSISVATTATPSSSRRSWALVAAGAALVGILAVAFVIRAMPSSPAPATSSPAAATTTGALIAVDAALATSVMPSSTASGPPSGTAPSTASGTASVAAAPTTRPSSRPGATIAPVASASSKPDCTNPYVRDELGRKIYKKECLE